MSSKQQVVPMEALFPLIQEQLSAGHSVTLTITGNSMSPLLCHRRDALVLSPCDNRTLNRGDLPLYRRADGQFVIHRVHSVQKDSYTMLGDAQTKKERGVPRDAVIALVTEITRKGKRFPCTDWRYRAYVWVWLAIRPLRPCVFFLLRVKSALVRRLSRQHS